MIQQANGTEVLNVNTAIQATFVYTSPMLSAMNSKGCSFLNEIENVGYQATLCDKYLMSPQSWVDNELKVKYSFVMKITFLEP